jgi:hypothetical protein
MHNKIRTRLVLLNLQQSVLHVFKKNIIIQL